MDAWIAQHVAPSGVPETVKHSAWSRVVRVPNAQGDVYFKAVPAASRHEAALTQHLHAWFPETSVPVIAADAQRGWLLLGDGGARLREHIRATRDHRAWRPVLAQYARLQHAATERVPAMRALGVPDRRSDGLAARVAQLLACAPLLHLDAPGGLARDEHAMLLARLPLLSDLAARLAGAGIADTLNHGDLTDGNIFISAGRAVFFDWGDAVISHPFFSLRTVLVSLYFSLGHDDGAPELDEVTGYYLDAWRALAPGCDVDATARLARALAPFNGALTWARVIEAAPAGARETMRNPIADLLREGLAGLANG